MIDNRTSHTASAYNFIYNFKYTEAEMGRIMQRNAASMTFARI